MWASYQGLGSIGVLLLEITAFTKLAGNAKGLAATGFALIEIGAAMKIFASAMADFGSMSLAGSEKDCLLWAALWRKLLSQ